MDEGAKENRFYKTLDGKTPFTRWYEKLQDARARVAISRRLERAQHGNFGDHKAVGEGVNELRIDLGPGYRVYVGQDGEFVVIILCGGDKDTQKDDIKLAKVYWRDYKRRKE